MLTRALSLLVLMVRSLHESIASLREFRFAPRAAICSGHLAVNLSAIPRNELKSTACMKKEPVPNLPTQPEQNIHIPGIAIGGTPGLAPALTRYGVKFPVAINNSLRQYHVNNVHVK